MSRIPFSQLVVKWHFLRDSLICILGSPHRAEMALGAMKLQAYYGECYASSYFLAAQAFRGEKCWDRLLRRLRELDMVRTRRRIRPDGKHGTNLIDLTRLWEYLKKALGKMMEDLRVKIFKVLHAKGYLLYKASVGLVYTETLIRAPPGRGTERRDAIG